LPEEHSQFCWKPFQTKLCAMQMFVFEKKRWIRNQGCPKKLKGQIRPWGVWKKAKSSTMKKAKWRPNFWWNLSKITRTFFWILLNMVIFAQIFLKQALKIYYFLQLSKGQKMAKWTYYFIFGIARQDDRIWLDKAWLN
jgi:hypothetical protein